MASDSNDRSDGPRQEYSFTYSSEAEDEPVSSILEAVATVTGTGVTDLDPLFSELDTDALNELLESMEPDAFSRPTGEDGRNGKVTFEYEGCLIEVTPGRISVRR